MSAEARMPDSNPFVEIAAHLFLEDLAAKVGPPGLNQYLMSLARNLAKSMPEEAYDTWASFLESLRDGRSILTTFEDVRPLTERCMATTRSPFERGWREYAKRVGAFAPVHREAAEVYNAKVRPVAVTSLHIVLHSFREAAAARIRVDSRPVRYEPLATTWIDGSRAMPSEAVLDGLLKRAGISRIQLGMLLRNHADVWLLEPA